VNLNRATAKAISRIGKELAAALEARPEKADGIIGAHGRLGNYSADYVLGLGVALGILWESINDMPVGKAHSLKLSELMQWVKNIQATDENLKKDQKYLT
jgi:hypothetical protein